MQTVEYKFGHYGRSESGVYEAPQESQGHENCGEKAIQESQGSKGRGDGALKETHRSGRGGDKAL